MQAKNPTTQINVVIIYEWEIEGTPSATKIITTAAAITTINNTVRKIEFMVVIAVSHITVK